MKNKLTTIGIIIATLVLAGVAVFTAIRLYQLRQQPVAPNVPSSKPKAAAAPKACTALTFTLGQTPTPTPTGSPTSTPTGSPTPTGTPTSTPTGNPTATPTGVPNFCNGTCGSNSNCQSDYVCFQGFCRNPSCPSQTSCACPGGPTSTPTPTGTQPSLPNAGTSLPTIFGIGLGSLLLIGAIFLAL